ncbi:MAG: hypothetical protein HYZ92_03320 [Candidatus Omnitrophica bacterium]|nr:hypothetical protein [Candidatus Omnitrophota bacterium]
MNFETICQNCGAPSSPAVGVCPYCKAVMVKDREEEKRTPAISKVRSLFNEGDVEQALVLAQTLETQKPDAAKGAEFALLYAQILIEVDGPSSKTRSVLNHALAESPSDERLVEYLEIVEAESNLSHDNGDAGEVALANVIRRSPDSAHALFLLGSHLFWAERDTQRSLTYLQRCVQLRPNFLRAKACLAAIYKTLNLDHHAERLLKECAAKTSDRGMKEFLSDFSKSG